VKAVDMAEATAPLSEYVRRARKETVVVTRRGKPVAALVPVGGPDWEDFVVSSHPDFATVMRRSEARYRVEGGVSLADVRRRYGLNRSRGAGGKRKGR
jgi:prevent-host-death family protein